MADLPDKQIRRLKTLLQEAETNVSAARELIASLLGGEDAPVSGLSENVGKVMEGIFDGQTMVGPDGKNYPVPANYASKSKLVQGDILKLTIADDGSFIYKQIGPIPRVQLVGTLNQKDGQFVVSVEDKDYKVLLASVTYFKAKAGDQVAIMVPEEGKEDADWSALEAVL